MCNCINAVNEDLRGRNGALVLTISFGPGTAAAYPTIGTHKLNPRGKQRPPAIVPTYCPWCGERYGNEAGFECVQLETVAGTETVQ